MVFMALLFGSPPATAVICKTVSEDGVVGYTDTPADKCSNPVRLPEYSRYKPRPLTMPADSARAAAPSNGEQPFNGYIRMEIVQPSRDGTVRGNEGRVPVRVLLEPALQEGHKVQFILDGRNAGPPSPSATAILTGVERGTHSLSAQVLDAKGHLLRSAEVVRFTLRKEAVTPTPGTGGSGEGAYTPDYGPAKDQAKTFQPAEGGTAGFDEPNRFQGGYGKSGQADYSTTPSAIPKSSGTNPAFAPRYKP